MRQKIARISLITGLALFVGQAPIALAQDAPPAPAPLPATKTEPLSPAPTPAIPPKSDLPPPAAVPALAPKNEASPPVAASVVPKQPNSVAVLDLGIRREHQDFFYDEKQSSKSAYKKKTRSGVDTQSTEDPGRTDPVRQAQMTEENALPPSGQTRAAAASDEDAQSESAYSKQFGYKRRVSYTEMAGLMTEVRMTLKQAGYTVIQPQGMFSKQMEMGVIPSIKERLAAGDFGNAQYVLIPNIVDASVRETQEHIQGTSDYGKRFEMSLTVEFTMVNTDTQAVMASFNASGSGSDMYLGKAYATFVPDMAMVKRNMLTTFGADVRKKLLEQLPKPGPDGIVEAKPGSPNPSSFPEGDPKTLKVYKLNESEKEVNKDGSSTEKKKEEVRIFRQ